MAVHNFNAGPSILPQIVFDQASAAVLNFNNTGLSILELGHRTPEFTAVMEEARALVKELMQLDEKHEVLFLHGGASTQFMQVPMNLLDAKDCAAYTDTDIWGHKAIKEAKLFGKVEVVCSSKEKNYNFIPKDFAVPNDAKYLHITSNNTIYGTQWQVIPKTSNCLVADMSSDIFSRVL
ncbi:MAG: aminotransferase class V-fold PLP-dependent enzyme, partial [Gloeobacteraceae cyanobacterium ES-bin-316]|nr:aminotransferase class V-fold PLP-dependent enzyme [Ferruginibacter sp.]